MKRFYFDLETRSILDLKKVGTVKYARDMATEITVFAWAVDDMPVRYWHYKDDVPHDLIEILENPIPYEKIAHNVLFDMELVRNNFAVNFDHIKLAEHWRYAPTYTDTQAIALNKRIGDSLDDVGFRLFNRGKNKEGRQLMLKQTRINPKTNKYIELDYEEREKFIKYAVEDVALCRAIHKKLPKLDDMEKKIFEWTLKRNSLGIRVDTRLLNAMDRINKYQLERMEKRFKEVTGLKMGSQKFIHWLRMHIPYGIPNLQAQTIRSLLGIKEIPAIAREMLQIRQASSLSSIAKVKAALTMSDDDRIHNNLKYHKAQTKRWAGQGVQPQNFPRTVGKQEIDPAAPDFIDRVEMAESFGLLDLKWVKNNLRRMWLPDPGKKFYCGDFSKIEPEVIFWYTGMGRVPDKWYEKTASAIYNVDYNEIGKESRKRHIGKTACLSCSYQAGPERFREMVQGSGTQITEREAKKAVIGYRRAHPGVVSMWYSLRDAFKYVLESGREMNVSFGGEPTINIKKLNYAMVNSSIMITLPSGGKLYYHDVWISEEMRIIDGVKKKVKVINYLNANGAKDKLYGGKLTEHIVSATSRDLLAQAILRLERSGFKVLCSVHDEVWASADEGQLEKFNELLDHRPSWGQNIHIESDCMVGDRYLK